MTDIVELKSERLSHERVVALVAADSCGAISTFIGTTRNHFAGKAVLHLEYEAYEPMALLEMRRLCERAREQWNVANIAIVHRTGVCPVGDASVIIAVASEHRRESLEAVAWTIDELKRRVPIWKLERYADGSEWKQNAEYDPATLVDNGGGGGGGGGDSGGDGNGKDAADREAKRRRRMEETTAKKAEAAKKHACLSCEQRAAGGGTTTPATVVKDDEKDAGSGDALR
jgi:molybdopterin synthase catalytic subunit